MIVDALVFVAAALIYAMGALVVVAFGAAALIIALAAIRGELGGD